MKPDLYTRFYLWLVAQRRWVLGITLVIAAVSFVISLRIDMDEDLLAMLPERDPLVDDYRYALRKFRQIDRVYLDVGVNADDPGKLAAAADEVFASLTTNAAYARILYRFEVGGQQKVIQYLTGALPNLFTEEDAGALAAKLEPAAIRDHLTAMRRKLAGPEGMVLKDVVAADPVGMTGLVVAKALPLQTGFGDAQIVDGRITSGDGRHVLLIAEPKFRSSNSRASEALVKDLLRTARAVAGHYPGVHVAITGGHRMTVDNATIIKADATRCISLGMGAMLILCLTAFRRRWLAVLAFLPSLFGTLIAGVVLALYWPHLSAIATGFASIAIGITVDYAIYIIYHLDNAASFDRVSVGRHLGRLVLPISIGALTTIAAFAVMATSPMRGYQQLGVFGAIGVIFSAAFALVVLPLLVPLAKSSGQPPLWLTQLMERFQTWQSNWRTGVLIGLVALTIVTAFGVTRLRFEGDVAKLNGITESTRSDEALINQTWGSALGMTLVVARGATPEEALAQNDRAAAALAHNPNVAAVYSLAAVCPATATQAANIQRWHEFWTPARRTAVRGTLQQVGTELGFRADAFAKFWQGVEGEPALLTLEAFRGTPLEQALNERVALGTNDTAVSTLIKLNDRTNVGKLREALPGLIVLDHKAFADHIAGMAQSGLSRFAVWTAVVVAAILYLTLASVELVAVTLLPLAFGLLWTFGAMGWLGLKIDLMNSVFVIFIIGVGEDYSVFLVTNKLDEWRGRPPRTAATTASVLISASTTIFGFGVLVLANHPVFFSMGTTVLLGMSFAFLATLILTPLCMNLLLFKDPPRGAPRWWHLLGTLWGGTHLIVGQIILFALAPFIERDRFRRLLSWATRGLIKGFPFGRFEYCDLTAATFDKPAIIISNHQSAIDVLIIKSLPGQIRMTMKKRIWDTPTLGWMARILGDLVIENDNPGTTLARCREALAANASVHFFPEGTRSFAGDLQRFRLGAFQLACELRQDILPVLLCDTNTAMPRDAYWFEPYRAVVRALPRVTPQTFDYNSGARELMKHCETLMHDALQAELDHLNSAKILRRKVARLYRYQGKWVEQFVYWKMRADPVFTVLDKTVPRQGLILDLGCGYGMASHWLASSGLDRQLLGVDYDADKIRTAQRSAPRNDRVRFEQADLLTWDYPPGDVVLLLDVLHYWTPDKQELILTKARQALRPGGRLILRDAARAETKAHGHVAFWEKFATQFGLNQTREGLHFQTEPELRAMIQRAGFANIQLVPSAGNDSNILLTATVAAPRSAAAQTP
ncbi:MAG: MMPL family transporter [Verrucomicrobiota bacterium]